MITTIITHNFAEENQRDLSCMAKEVAIGCCCIPVAAGIFSGLGAASAALLAGKMSVTVVQGALCGALSEGTSEALCVFSKFICKDQKKMTPLHKGLVGSGIAATSMTGAWALTNATGYVAPLAYSSACGISLFGSLFGTIGCCFCLLAGPAPLTAPFFGQNNDMQQPTASLEIPQMESREQIATTA